MARLQASLALEDYGAMLDEHIIVAPSSAEGCAAQPLEPGAPRDRATAAPSSAVAGRPPAAPRDASRLPAPDAAAATIRGEARDASPEAPPRGDIRDTPEYRAAVELEIWKEHQKALFEKEVCVMM